MCVSLEFFMWIYVFAEFHFLVAFAYMDVQNTTISVFDVFLFTQIHRKSIIKSPKNEHIFICSQGIVCLYRTVFLLYDAYAYKNVREKSTNRNSFTKIDKT